jgi:outer membrane protein TolC
MLQARKFIKCVVMPVAVLTFFVVTATAQQGPLTLEMCVAMAMQSNLRLETAAEKLVEMDAVIDEAATANLPTLSAQASYTRLIPQPKNPMAEGLGPLLETFGLPAPADKYSGNIYNAGLNLTHLLYTGGKIKNAQKIAGHGRVVSEWQQKSAIREIRRDVTKAYYQALAVNKSVVALDSAIALMEVMVSDLKNAVEVGMRGEHELLQAEVQLSNQRLVRQQVTTGATAAHDYLATLIGVPVNTPITLVNELQSPASLNVSELTSLQAKARDVSTDLKALDEQLKIIETSLEITKAANHPTVFASAGYSGGQSAGAEAGKFTWNNNGNVTLGLQWDIYNGNAKDHKVKQTLSQKRQLELTMENIRVNLDMGVKNSVAMLTDAFSSIETNRQSIAQTKRSYEISYDKFQEGMLLSSEVLNSQNLILQAEISYYSSLSDFYARQADLEYLVGEGK